MTDEQIQHLAFFAEAIKETVVAVGGSDEDWFLIAAVARAMVLAPGHQQSAVDRVKRINELAGEVEWILKGLFVREGEEGVYQKENHDKEREKNSEA